MPLDVHSLIRIAALGAEMSIHTGLFALIAAAMFAQKAGAYEALQFSTDIAVMSTITGFMWFKYMYKDAEPSRIPNVICFSIILSLSLTGAMGLTIRAASGDGFCEEFLSAHPEKCREAGLAIAMSWTSVIFAIAGILVSWLDKHPGAVEVRKLYAPRRPAREIELLRQQFTSEPTNAPLRIHVPRPPASHAAPRPRGPHYIQGPVPARTLPGHPQRILSANGPAPLMLNRTVHGPVGQTPRNRLALTRIEDVQTLPSNVNPIRGSAQTVNEKDMWKLKFLV